MNQVWPIALILMTTAVIALSPSIQRRPVYAEIEPQKKPKQ